jgi:hypothetical protein
MTNDESFVAAAQAWKPQTPVPVSFRLYHDASGSPLYYSMESHSDAWIEVTKEQFHRASHKVRVENGSLVPTPEPRAAKLRPSESGTRCHAENVAIIVHQEPSRYWSYHE